MGASRWRGVFAQPGTLCGGGGRWWGKQAQRGGGVAAGHEPGGGKVGGGVPPGLFVLSASIYDNQESNSVNHSRQPER